MHSVCVRVCLCSVGRQIKSFRGSHYCASIDGSPHLSYRWHSIFSVCTVRVYLCLSPTERPVVPMWTVKHVSLCMWQPPLFLCLPPHPRGESCWWHCPGSGAAEPALGGILCLVGREAGMAGLPDKGTHKYTSTHIMDGILYITMFLFVSVLETYGTYRVRL